MCKQNGAFHLEMKCSLKDEMFERSYKFSLFSQGGVVGGGDQRSYILEGGFVCLLGFFFFWGGAWEVGGGRSQDVNQPSKQKRDHISSVFFF